MNVIQTGEYSGLRIVDLLAKLSKTSRRDVLKVLAAVNVCADFLQIPYSDMQQLPVEAGSALREPTSISYAMCERAFNAIELNYSSEEKERFDALR